MMMLTNYGGNGGSQGGKNSAMKIDHHQQNLIVNSKSLSKAMQIRTKAENLFKRQLNTFHPSGGSSTSHISISGLGAHTNKQYEFLITLETRNEILKMLNDYYTRIPLTNVIWNTSDVKLCLHNSMASLDHFDPYKAKQAFKLISNMLMNLINRYWLKEYHRIITYGGKFKSQILHQLYQDNCINIYRRAGYLKDNDDVLRLNEDFTLSHKNVDVLTSTMFDLMMAETICQDVIDVYENSRLCKSVSSLANGNAGNNQSSSTHSKQQVSVNYKCWIKSYYKQRLDLLTDCSALNIHNKLNNVVMVASLDNGELSAEARKYNHSATNRKPATATSPRTSDQHSTSRDTNLLDEIYKEEPFESDNSYKCKQPKSNSKFYITNYSDEHINERQHTPNKDENLPRFVPAREDSSGREKSLPSLNSTPNRNLYNTAPLIKAHMRGSNRIIQHNISHENDHDNNNQLHANFHPANIFDVPHNDEEPLITARLSDLRIDNDNLHDQNNALNSAARRKDKNDMANYRGTPTSTSGSDSRRSSIYDNVDGSSPINYPFKTAAALAAAATVDQQLSYHRATGTILNSKDGARARHQNSPNGFTSSSHSPKSYEHHLSSDPSLHSARLHVILEDKKRRVVNYQPEISSYYPKLWSCDSCTFSNSSKTSVCEMCQKARSRSDPPMIECPHCK